MLFKVFSKEYVNRDFNLKLTIPDDYTILDSVSIEEVAKNVEKKVSADYLKSLQQTLSNNQVLYFVDNISLVNHNDNIIKINRLNLLKNLSNSISKFCILELIED